ncbi:nitrogen regulation protein NR(I) [Brachymonas denitrificans]|uniref:nitrogen regulation protein NR(I) n=1 Tax=Brachymonas denitrificans TaxID=28220 RepID=UPI0024C49CA5|nr:nitrogen regulation protein NR(I) [Brachymonas denitrificans]
MKSVWIVDDDASIRFVLERALQRAQLPSTAFESPSQVLAALEDPATHGVPEVLVSDIRMPDAAGLSGLDLLARVHAAYPQLPVIVMTAFSDLDSAVSAFQGGAYEYLPKPFDVQRAVELVRRAVEQRRGAAEPERSGEQPELAQEMLGQAPAMQEVFRAIGRLAHSAATVLITGESGTGKELVARALHRHSPRADGPFVAINTAAIPRDLLESELFGHERGAFTGAQAQRRGRFEQAEGGTLFLDEIGDMPFELQTRLLRVLSDGQFFRVGGQQAVKARVRIIAATHQDLEERVREGVFREDLFHRLNVIRLRLPALRERREDIGMLARHFLQRSAQQLGMEPKRLGVEAGRQLAAFDFPGNVRQLENICHWLTVMAPSQVVEVADLPEEVREAVREVAGAAAGGSEETLADEVLVQSVGEGGLDIAPPWQEGLRQHALELLMTGHGGVWDTLMAECERALILAAMEWTGQRRIEAAQRLGIGRNTISRKMNELGLD